MEVPRLRANEAGRADRCREAPPHLPKRYRSRGERSLLQGSTELRRGRDALRDRTLALLRERDAAKERLETRDPGGVQHFLVGLAGGALIGFLIPIAYLGWTP